jgi:hypothetical protein
MGCFNRLPSSRQVYGLRRSIEDFDLGDRVSLQVSPLSIEARDRDSSNCDACEQYQCELVTRSDGIPSDCAIWI